MGCTIRKIEKVYVEDTALTGLTNKLLNDGIDAENLKQYAIIVKISKNHDINKYSPQELFTVAKNISETLSFRTIELTDIMISEELIKRINLFK